MTIDNLTIAYLRMRYKSGDLNPSQLVSYLRERSQAYLDKNIWIYQLSETEVSCYLDQLNTKNIDDHPLWGIPFVVKDNIDLAGIPTTAGCPAFAYTPEEHAFVVQQLIDAGAIPLGKMNLDQFATGLVGVRSPEPWGPCKNAFNDDYISGGSSSGSAVAVALGLASFSLGTDTAGSGRVPAAFNNIIGLKPSRGLLSCRGVVPACRSLDCVSIFAGSSDDAYSVFDVAARFDREDAYSRNNINTNRKNYGCYQQPFRFAVPLEEQLAFFGNGSAAKCFAQAIEQLMAIGGEKVVVDCSALFDAAKLLYSGPWVAERYVATEKIITEQPDAMLPVIQTIIGGSQADATAADTFKAFYQLQAYKQKADQLFRDVDIVVTPTAGTIYSQQDLQDDPIQLNSNLGYYTNFMNLLDYSGIAIPAGFLDSGLPFGITLAGKAFDDTKLLSIASRWQHEGHSTIGATQWLLPALNRQASGVMDTIDVAVCGAHLDGLPLNWQLKDRQAVLVEATTTANQYRLYALAGGPPFRPGLIRDKKGTAIDVEVWRLPASEFGSFVAGIPQPLGIGKVELADGRWLPSFICEPCGLEGAEEITSFGGWRHYIKTR